MRILKQGRGVVIELSESEMTALDHLYTLGVDDVANDEAGQTALLSPAEKRALKRIIKKYPFGLSAES